MPLKLVENRTRRPWLVYAAVAVGVTILLSALLFLGSKRITETLAPDRIGNSYMSDSIAAADAVHAFAAFTLERRADPQARIEIAYTAEGIRRLAAALSAVANRDAATRPSQYRMLAAMLEAANAVENDERAWQHADLVRVAFTTAGTVLHEIQQTRYPELARAVREIRNAAGAIRADRALLTQGDEIQRYFDRAADVLRGMLEVGI